MLPREEEPQIKVPMIDVLVGMPGASAAEVENRATRPMEKLLWEIPGVEYLYSTSSPGQSLVIVRYKVGHRHRGRAGPAQPEAAVQLRPYPHGRDTTAGEAAHDRRRADAGPHLPQRHAGPSHAAPPRRAGG
jgi:hypothetical protein